MKRIAIIGTILTLLILTAGCLDDLSSTLPPCCDGTCDGVKTSVITVDCTTHRNDFTSSKFKCYAFDSDNLQYGFGDETDIVSDRTNYMNLYRSYNNHNVTFSYSMVDGHRHITGIIEDHDAVKPKCECVKKCCGCGE